MVVKHVKNCQQTVEIFLQLLLCSLVLPIVTAKFQYCKMVQINQTDARFVNDVLLNDLKRLTQHSQKLCIISYCQDVFLFLTEFI